MVRVWGARAPGGVVRGVFVAAVAAIACVGQGIASNGAAQSQEGGQATSFAIPAGSLSAALTAFGQQSGLQVTFLSEIAAGKTSPGFQGQASSEQALEAILAGSGLSYSFPNATTVAISEPIDDAGATIDGAIALGTITVSGGGAGQSDVYTPYETAAPTAHISSKDIERFRGQSPADMFRGTPGVMSGEARNGGSSVDVNIRGMQGMGRVSVKVDGAENMVTIYQGYQGVSNRTFVDPDFLAGIDITKGSDAASSGIAGTVNMRTVDAGDIVKPGDNFGFRVKGELGGNSTSPTAGADAGYDIRNIINGYPIVTPSPDGMDRPNALKPTQGSGSVVGAVTSDEFDLLAGYAHRMRGNYYAGTNGRSTNPVSKGSRPFCYPSGDCPFDYLDYVENDGLTNYRAGEEVLNTELETKSWLMKATFRFEDGQSVKFGYNAFRSEAGDILASRFNSDTSQETQQELTAGVKLDTATMKYRWQPDDNEFVDLTTNLWVTQLEQRNPLRVKSYVVTTTTLGLPDDFRVGSDTMMWGADVSNTSRLSIAGMPVQLTYGASYKNEETHPSEYTEALELVALRDGTRQEAASYGKVAWDAADWLTLTGGLRYQHYWSKDSSPSDSADTTGESHGQRRDQGGFSPSVGMMVKPFEGAQLYVNYSNAMRMPSMMEALTGFSTRYNADLVPERSRNWELGANFIAHGALAPSDRGMLKFGYFNWDVQDYLAREWRDDFVAPSGSMYSSLRVYNIDRAKFEGLELSTRYELGGFTADLAANYYLNVEFCPTEDQCENKTLYSDYATNQIPPKYMIDLTLSQKFFDDDLTIGGRIHHVGKRAVEHGQVTAQGLSEFIALVDWDRYTLVDLFAEYKLTDSLTASVRVENVTDQYYVDPLSLVQQPSPGRTVYAGITKTLGGSEAMPTLFPFAGMGANPASSVDWSGPYLGFHTGGGFAHEQGTTTALDGTPGGIPGTESADLDLKPNYLYGVQAGFNYQFANGLVLGIEGQYSKTKLSASNKAFATEEPLADTGELQAETHYNIDWMSVLRGKVGYAFDNGLLAYATGGVTFMQEETSRDQYRADGTSRDGFPYGKYTEIISADHIEIDRTGWTVGGGLEYAINSRWSINADYSYTRFNARRAKYAGGRAGVSNDYSVTEIVGYGDWVDPADDPNIAPFCDILPQICEPYQEVITETTVYEGSADTVNGRESSNWIDLHSFKIGINYHF
jgi:hemoglobin/transferrin/lactoferrin receptor protein